MQKEQITWRSWFDGGGTSGPIASKWNVRGWPTLYLLDAKGVIRDKCMGYRDFDKLIDQLVEEASAQTRAEPAKK
jgi:hypothetical protein